MKDFIFLYGPPASGKSSVGKLLAESLDLPFTDLDREISAIQVEAQSMLDQLGVPALEA